MDYRLVIDSDALQYLLTFPSQRRQRVFDWIEKTKVAPFTRGRWQTSDATGREIEVSFVAGFNVYHWTDHPARTVVVTGIEVSF